MRLIGLGAGGHAKVIIEILGADSRYELYGLLDARPELKGRKVLGVPVLGDDSLLPEIRRDVSHFFVGLGGTGDNGPRRRLFELARGLGFEPVKAIHPSAAISPSAIIGEGAVIAAGAIVNADARLGANVIVNSGAIVEHDCVVGDHVHIATGAKLASTVTVGTGAHIGAGATVLQCITIGENALVGIGSVVVRDVPPGATVMGNPARLVPKTGND